MNKRAVLRSWRAAGALIGSVVGLALMACVPIFTDGLFQNLSLSFRFDRLFAAGEQTLVHTSTFPEDVKVKKNFVQISGLLTGEDLPGSVTVKAELENPVSGKVAQKVSIKLQIADDGTFKGNAKVKKNVKAGEILTVTLEPAGSPIVKGTEITICVDLVKKRGDLSAVPPCIEEEDDDNGGGGGEITFSSLQNDFFTPTCARAGCHSAGTSAGGLSLAAGSAHTNLVNAPSSQRPGLNRVTPNDPENSYLIHKLRGDASISGSRMPQGGPFLTDAELQRFIDWIDNGAPND